MGELEMDRALYLLIIALYLYVIHTFFEFFLEKRRMKAGYMFAAYVLYYAALGALSFRDDWSLAKLCVNLFFMLGIALCYRRSVPRRVMAAAILYYLAMFSEIFAAAAMAIFKGESLPVLLLDKSFYTWSNLASPLAYFAIVKLAERILKRSDADTLPFLRRMICIVIPAGSVIMLHVLFSIRLFFARAQLDTAIMLLFAVILIVNALNFCLYDKVMREVFVYSRTQLLRRQLECYDRQRAVTERMREEIKAIRCDLKEQLTRIPKYLRSGDNAELESFIGQLAGVLDNTKARLYSGNPVIDSILYHKMAYAKSVGVDFAMELRIPPDFHFDAANLCVILGNALDNAIEACRKVHGVKREVFIAMYYECYTTYIEIVNPYEGSLKFNEDGDPVSTKPNGKLYGMGLNSMRKLMEEQQHYMNVSHSEREFKVELLFFDES